MPVARNDWVWLLRRKTGRIATIYVALGAADRLRSYWLDCSISRKMDYCSAEIDAVERPPQVTVGMKINNARTKSGNRVRNLDAE
jgi:hypothetical protein